MAYDETLAQRVRKALTDRVTCDELRMFGGLAFTVNGHVCCGVVGRDLMLRVGPERYEKALERPHAREMDFTGRPLKTMIYVSPPGLKRAPALRSWLDMALDFVTTLEPKSTTSRTRKKTVAAKKTAAKKTTKKTAAKKTAKKAGEKKVAKKTTARAGAKSTKTTKKPKKATARPKKPAAKRSFSSTSTAKSKTLPKTGAKKTTRTEPSTRPTRPPSKPPRSAEASKKPSLRPARKSMAPPQPETVKSPRRVSIRPVSAPPPRQSLRPRSLLPIGPFTGFSKKTLRYLKELGANNDKAWFEEHRGHYESFYLKPALEFIAAVGPKLRKISPSVQYEPRVNGSLFRIQRDIRFSKDKTPYKAHIDLWFWHGDRKNWSTPGYFFRLEPRKLTLGGGTHRFEATQIQSYREAVVDAERGSELDYMLAQITKHKHFSLGGSTRKVVPRGFDEDHHRAKLLLHDGLFASYEGPPPAELHDPTFVDFCADKFEKLSPVVDWLMRL